MNHLSIRSIFFCRHIFFDGKFAKEGVLKSKNARKQTCLRIEKYRGKSVSEIEMEEKYLSSRPITDPLKNTEVSSSPLDVLKYFILKTSLSLKSNL